MFVCFLSQTEVEQLLLKSSGRFGWIPREIQSTGRRLDIYFTSYYLEFIAPLLITHVLTQF